MARSDDDRVLEIARQAIDLARFAQPRYAAGKQPLSSSELSALLVRTHCHEEEFAFPGDDIAFTLPRVNGVNIIAINRLATRADRRFAVRHELHHVLCGEAEEITYLSEHDYQSVSERAADLFALADLIPACLLDTFRRARWSWRDIRTEIETQIRDRWGPDWPWARVDDRARLRLRLYRECGI